MGDITDHFSRKEFACNCGCGFAAIDIQIVQALEILRNKICKPIVILSGCRCPAHNAAVNGSPKSQHLCGRAADIAVKGMRKDAIAKAAEAVKIFEAGGIGKYSWGVHLDIRDTGAVRWENRKNQKRYTNGPAVDVQPLTPELEAEIQRGIERGD